MQNVNDIFQNQSQAFYEVSFTIFNGLTDSTFNLL